ncbi:hypothetical protein EDD85DRAFT_939754 [Armillaria nabsnona]|nr:hypothetical protein EDD85DRAFT_939754 [Armillaria nabsnona]
MDSRFASTTFIGITQTVLPLVSIRHPSPTLHAPRILTGKYGVSNAFNLSSSESRPQVTNPTMTSHTPFARMMPNFFPYKMDGQWWSTSSESRNRLHRSKGEKLAISWCQPNARRLRRPRESPTNTARLTATRSTSTTLLIRPLTSRSSSSHTVAGSTWADVCSPRTPTHNLGSFFATRGFVTVVPDYRIVDSSAQFPGAAQDVRDAMQWIVDNFPFPDSVIFVLGHSAGAMNMFTDSIRLYYGEDAEAIWKVPLALLDSASVPTPWLLRGICERDIPCLHPAVEKFGERLKAMAVWHDEFVAKGHNHVSLVFSLGTGQGEEWAEDVVKWIPAPWVPYHLI